MVVYVELVILDNLVIDYLLLKTTFFLVKGVYSKFRLLLSALLGCAVALIIPLISHLTILSMAVKILTGFLITITAKNYKGVKEYFICTAIFFLLTFALGGSIIAIFSFFNLSESNSLSIGLTLIPAYLSISFIKSVFNFIKRKQTINQNCVNCRVVLNNLEINAIGFFDTGNGVYSRDMPVVFCNRSLALKLISKKLKLPNVSYISVNTIAGKENLLSFKLDKIMIYMNDKENIYNNVVLAVSKHSVGVGYDILLHPDLLGECYDECDCKIKKVS